MGARHDQGRYRPEIDGLRAVAVVAVILYHAQLGIVPGGYLGVDVFFVISGFLITGIIEADLAAGRFSIARFYERRVRRIIPALLVMMALCVPVAWRLMLPDDLENFGQSLVATTLFANNVLLMLTSGYFAMASAFKPLVHTWTLGVEEQYYLLVPLLLAGMFRWGGRRGTVVVIAVITIASFVSALVCAQLAPIAGFYLLPTRAWEIGAGSLVALWRPTSTRHEAVATAGLAMILVPLFVFGDAAGSVWPIAIPVVGTCLVLAFAGAGSFATRALSWRPFVAIGLISYSLYLYHQPVLAFIRVASLDQPSRAAMAAAIVPIFALGWLSWRFVERPFRDRKAVRLRTVAIASMTLALPILAIGGAMAATSGFYASWPELAERDTGFGAAQNQAYNLAVFGMANAPLPDASDRTRVLVLGNSFARDFVNMGFASGNFGHHIVSYDPATCPLSFSTAERRNLANADFVVFGSSGGRCLTRWLPVAARDTHARLIVIGTKNFGWNNNAVMLLDPSVRYQYRAKVLTDALAKDAMERQAVPPSMFVDLLAMLMDDRQRVAVFTPDRKFISQDRQHLTRAGAAYVGDIAFRHPLLRALADGVSSSPGSRK